MEIERVELEPRTLAGVNETVAMSELTDYFARAFETTATELSRQGAFPIGPPIALYRGAPTETVDVTAGFPVARPVSSDGPIVMESLPGGPAVQAVHTGSYDDLPTAYSAIADWFSEQGLTASPQMWEEYLVGPDSEPDPSRWQTRIVYPLEHPM
jgi:effector-binding domain-containing protein